MRKKNPEGFERAHENYNNETQDVLWTDEIMQSLKSLFEHTNGISLKDWSIGAYSYSYIRIEFDNDDTGELSGPRSMAWLENNLLGDLRIKFEPYGRIDKEHQFKSKRAHLSQYGKFYRPGMIHPCPFTGYCFDETLLESLQKDIRHGDTLKEAFEALADITRKEFEGELDYQQSDEYFLENEDSLYTLDGTRV